MVWVVPDMSLYSCSLLVESENLAGPSCSDHRSQSRVWATLFLPFTSKCSVFLGGSRIWIKIHYCLRPFSRNPELTALVLTVITETPN